MYLNSIALLHKIAFDPLLAVSYTHLDLKISFKSNKDGQTSELTSKEPTFKKVLLEGVYAVSYTHLDVYKRQDQLFPDLQSRYGTYSAL